MAFSLPLAKGIAIFAVAAMLAGAAFAPTLPADAAQLRGQQGFQAGNGDQRGPFNVDPNPCRAQDGRGRGQGGPQFCNQPPARPDRGDNGGGHRPGSSAFGLQFDYGQ